eukprot:9918421-Ditylum_brightwellii.AAC.1
MQPLTVPQVNSPDQHTDDFAVLGEDFDINSNDPQVCSFDVLKDLLLNDLKKLTVHPKLNKAIQSKPEKNKFK